MDDKIRAAQSVLSASTVLKTWLAGCFLWACCAWFPQILTHWFMVAILSGHIVLGMVVIRKGRLRIAPLFNGGWLDLICIAAVPLLGSLVWLYNWRKQRRRQSDHDGAGP
jgi:hypothetical protein